uniref:Uncharacterized protein n=1 Tax=Oryza sativa subsp. japonica TaxID=39947 RepID=Q6ZFZ9_ORYSJ|nr:hypothetical protein [Oryza sativa Japonica Group]
MGERKAATAEEEQERRKREAATAEEEAVPTTRSASATRGDGRRRIRTGDSHRTSPLPSDPHSCAPNPPCPVGRALHRRRGGAAAAAAAATAVEAAHEVLWAHGLRYNTTVDGVISYALTAVRQLRWTVARGQGGGHRSAGVSELRASLTVGKEVAAAALLHVPPRTLSLPLPLPPEPAELVDSPAPASPPSPPPPRAPTANPPPCRRPSPFPALRHACRPPACAPLPLTVVTDEEREIKR